MDDEEKDNFEEYLKLKKLNSLLETLIDYVKQIYLIISQIVFPPS